MGPVNLLLKMMNHQYDYANQIKNVKIIEDVKWVYKNIQKDYTESKFNDLQTKNKKIDAWLYSKIHCIAHQRKTSYQKLEVNQM